MKLAERVDAFAQLGEVMANLSQTDKNNLFELARAQNAWFTNASLELAWSGIIQMLSLQTLAEWAGRYSLSPSLRKKVGVVMAGNIPLVGFHDFLCVLISGHELVAKASSKDEVLIKYLTQKLIEIEPRYGALTAFQERLNGCEAIIATGSDNTSRYFEYYFRNIPHIIRKNRSSCGVVMGEETETDFTNLGLDVFSYFGLGCRNVAKLYVPEGFDLPSILKSWEPYQEVIHHNKYANNYEYNKSVYLVTRQPFLDTGFVMLKESTTMVSPISVVFYESYSSLEDLRQKVASQQQKVQCVVSAKGWFKGSVPFGKAQFPTVYDYADQVDTLDFLSRI